MAKSQPQMKRKNCIINRLRIRLTGITHSFLMAKYNLPICSTHDTKLSVKHINPDCLKYNQDRIEHKIPLKFVAAL